MPAASTIMQIAQLLDVEVALLLTTAVEPHKTPNVVLVDDNPIALEGMLPVLQEALPGANVIGPSGPAEALDYFVAHPVALAFFYMGAAPNSQSDGIWPLDITPSPRARALAVFSPYHLTRYSHAAMVTPTSHMSCSFSAATSCTIESSYCTLMTPSSGVFKTSPHGTTKR